MTISSTAWTAFLVRLRKVNDAATDKMLKYIERYGMPQTQEQINAAIDYAFGLATKYGEAAAELACQMYDATALASGVMLPASEPAATATMHEVAKAIQGTVKTGNANIVAAAVGRQVKMAGVDTTLKNAVRDEAEFAWIPHGETCAYCLMLSALGWQKAGKKTLKGGHAEHVHANCDCTYAIRFNESTRYTSYNPDKYNRMILDATDGEYDAGDLLRQAGRTSRWGGRDYSGLNMVRREFYADSETE